ncbi:MAG TPA: Rieske 2Fe-2S domain-containing protein [Candidatus Binataceae bacterium]|nr:Rieske 2Fe-2S domain-containing protein [Candidatus Binataceae bacterium]
MLPDLSNSSFSVDGLVREDRVHRRVYEDPTIFDLEMERIFGRAWVYVGHESQIPKPGDYMTTFIGKSPVIFCRHSDGKAYVLHNRCGHRGALVCNVERGNTGRVFMCPYHGWTFQTNGDLHGVPAPDCYTARYDLNAPEFGLVRVERVGSHKGFTFASLSRHGAAFALPNLMRKSIDTITERAPDGEIEVTGGVHRYAFRGNWKAQLENSLDHYHAPFSHASTRGSDSRQFQRRAGEASGTRLLDEQGGLTNWDKAEAVGYADGSGYVGPMPGANAERNGPLFDLYKAALLKTRSAGDVSRILGDEWYHNAAFYPNMAIQLRALYIRVIRPMAVDHTEVRVYPIRLKGAPDEMFHQQIKFLNLTHAAGSLIQTDDLEMFRRIQVGLRGSGTDWVVFGRGYGMETPKDGGLLAPGTSEVAQRAQYRAWKHYMSLE